MAIFRDFRKIEKSRTSVLRYKFSKFVTKIEEIAILKMVPAPTVQQTNFPVLVLLSTCFLIGAKSTTFWS